MVGKSIANDEQLRQLASIFESALDTVDPYAMISEHVSLYDNVLVISTARQRLEYDLAQYSQVIVLGAGKAAAPMARAIETVLGNWLTSGVVVVKYGHTSPLQKVRVIEAGHPVPDESGVAGAREILRMADRADGDSLVITLVSGGGSALLPYPGVCWKNGREQQLTLDDKQRVTETLLGCGADITEINCVRKHLSGIKGGRLLNAIAPARSVNLILSDVVGDDLASIASGLTAVDPTTFSDALQVIERYSLAGEIPLRVLEHLQAGSSGDAMESLKPGAAPLKLSDNVLLGTNRVALEAAAKRAGEMGYGVVKLTSRITGDAEEVAKMLAAIAADGRSGMIGTPPLCIISGGEPVVTLTGNGKGGRNQQLALRFLLEMSKNPELYEDVRLLAASTDGNDGPTDAAGAFATLEVVGRCLKQRLDMTAYLQNNDAYTLFQQTGGLYQTGPTNTNVCDLHIMLIGRAVS